MSEADVLEDAMERIRRMPEGEEKQARITQLFQDYPGLDAILEDDMARADENADTEMPSGIRAGGQFVAASPLSHLSAGLRQGLGAYQQVEARDAMEGLSQEKTDALGGVVGGGLSGELRRPGGSEVGEGYTTPEYVDSGAYSELFDEFGTEDVPAWELGATTAAESAYDPNAVSSAGAVGLMQLMPGTGEDMGIPRDQRSDPRQNVMGGSKYLNQMKGKYDNMELANAAYNAGPGRVDKLRPQGTESYADIRSRLPEETRNYTDRLKEKRDAARARGIEVGYLDELEDEEEDWMSQALRGYA